ncbi:MAG: hypothetical protein MUC66_00230 [Methanolinea sp.]|nr:hypothetical protein [Methanolinea sp.]
MNIVALLYSEYQRLKGKLHHEKGNNDESSEDLRFFSFLKNIFGEKD